MTSEEAIRELKKIAEPGYAKSLQWFFKTGPGQYGEGDVFLGVRMPKIRVVAKQFRDLSFAEVEKLSQHRLHEVRMCGLVILSLKYPRANESEREKIYRLYRKLARDGYVNNWDLVDVTCNRIVGAHLERRKRKDLYTLARSKNLWEQRIAIVSSGYFIRNNEFEDTLKISDMLLDHPHDLIHKAVGWMLREVGKKDQAAEEAFLREHYRDMPRTMLRYAIEKFPEGKRQAYLRGEIR